MAIKYTDPQKGEVLKNDGHYIIISGIVAQVGQGISASDLKQTARWTFGLPIELNGRKVGQVDNFDMQGDDKLSIQGTLIGGKLTQQELFLSPWAF
ncbi:MAG: hypothetical protein ACE14P_06250 [Methanotrichaceae archaeon]